MVIVVGDGGDGGGGDGGCVVCGAEANGAVAIAAPPFALPGGGVFTFLCALLAMPCLWAMEFQDCGLLQSHHACVLLTCLRGSNRCVALSQMARAISGNTTLDASPWQGRCRFVCV